MESLLESYLKFERLAKNYDGGNSLDISTQFIAPTTLIPLLCFAKRENITNFITHNSKTDEYLNRIINKRETSTTHHFEELPLTKEERGKKMKLLINLQNKLIIVPMEDIILFIMS